MKSYCRPRIKISPINRNEYCLKLFIGQGLVFNRLEFYLTMRITSRTLLTFLNVFRNLLKMMWEVFWSCFLTDWPSIFPDLSLLDFFLWGYLKETDKPATLAELFFPQYSISNWIWIVSSRLYSGGSWLFNSSNKRARFDRWHRGRRGSGLTSSRFVRMQIA